MLAAIYIYIERTIQFVGQSIMLPFFSDAGSVEEREKSTKMVDSQTSTCLTILYILV